MEINDLNVKNEIKHAIFDMGFEELTPIQVQTIPACLENRDVIGQSQTGTGKTAAFAIPILEKIDPELKMPQALILCPTRELAVQVADEFKKIAKYLHNIKIVAVYGGEPINRQIMALKRGAQVIIGTPGRTIDHITKRHTLKTEYIKTMVLDEADEMLKMGFREDIELVLESISNERQTILFSATMPKTILNITNKYQNNPELIKVKTKEISADTVKQQYCDVKASHKLEALSRLITVNKPNRCIVFCNMKVKVDETCAALAQKGYVTDKIHGDLRQEVRMRVLRNFNDSKVNVLVATDVAARGLDIKDVDLIINYDVPEKEEYYVHRIGRSGRAGKDGHSITLVSRGDNYKIINIMHYTKHQIEKIKIPTIKQVNEGKTDMFVQEISESIQNENLDDYKEILNKFDTVFTIEDICAALIKLNLEFEENLFQNDINLSHQNNQRSSKNNNNNNNKKRNDDNRSSSKGKKRKKDGKMARIFITVGRKDHVKTKHIVGAVINECNIDGDDIGAVDILDNFSFFDVKKEVAEKVVKKLDGVKINERKVAVEIAKSKK